MPGLVPGFAYFARYFAKRRRGSRTRTAKSKVPGNDNEDTDDDHRSI
jgi:hypothetical protein